MDLRKPISKFDSVPAAYLSFLTNCGAWALMFSYYSPSAIDSHDFVYIPWGRRESV